MSRKHEQRAYQKYTIAGPNKSNKIKKSFVFHIHNYVCNYECTKYNKILATKLNTNERKTSFEQMKSKARMLTKTQLLCHPNQQ